MVGLGLGCCGKQTQIWKIKPDTFRNYLREINGVIVRDVQGFIYRLPKGTG